MSDLAIIKPASRKNSNRKEFFANAKLYACRGRHSWIPHGRLLAHDIFVLASFKTDKLAARLPR